MRLSVTRLTEFPSACRHQAGLGPLASHYSELFGTEGDFNTALDLADIELAAEGSGATSLAVIPQYRGLAR